MQNNYVPTNMIYDYNIKNFALALIKDMMILLQLKKCLLR